MRNFFFLFQHTVDSVLDASFVGMTNARDTKDQGQLFIAIASCFNTITPFTFVMPTKEASKPVSSE
jgi:hypothetical protein